MTESCHVHQGRQMPPAFPLKPHTLSCVWGWFNPHISVGPPISCNLLAAAGGRGRAPSVRGSDHPNILTPLHLQGGQNSSLGYLVGKGERGIPLLGPALRWGLAVPPPRNMCRRTHAFSLSLSQNPKPSSRKERFSFSNS